MPRRAKPKRRGMQCATIGVFDRLNSYFCNDDQNILGRSVYTGTSFLLFLVIALSGNVRYSDGIEKGEKQWHTVS